MQAWARFPRLCRGKQGWLSGLLGCSWVTWFSTNLDTARTRGAAPGLGIAILDNPCATPPASPVNVYGVVWDE